MITNSQKIVNIIDNERMSEWLLFSAKLSMFQLLFIMTRTSYLSMRWRGCSLWTRSRPTRFAGLL